ncbi:MAG: MFS transporter [Candidatus Vogelbacteria bacterium]|nr:MFS transporter [Candidatus Vogelbacteria bacterium]
MNPKEKILLYASNMWTFADGMLGPLLAIFTERIGGSILDVSSAWAIYWMVTGIFVIIIGRFSDHHPKEKILIAGYALSALFTFSYLLVRSPTHLFFVQAGSGFALALSNPSWYALYGKYSDKKRAGAMWGLADGEGKIMNGIAILLGGYIVKTYSFDILFVIMGVVQIIATLYLARILHTRRFRRAAITR